MQREKQQLYRREKRQAVEETSRPSADHQGKPVSRAYSHGAIEDATGTTKETERALWIRYYTNVQSSPERCTMVT